MQPWSSQPYEQVKQALDESVQQREAEQAEHVSNYTVRIQPQNCTDFSYDKAQVVEQLRNKLARGKEKRAALRAALSETQGKSE